MVISYLFERFINMFLSFWMSYVLFFSVFFLCVTDTTVMLKHILQMKYKQDTDKRFTVTTLFPEKNVWVEREFQLGNRIFHLGTG